MIETIDGVLNGDEQDESPVDGKKKSEKDKEDVYAGMDLKDKVVRTSNGTKCGTPTASVDPELIKAGVYNEASYRNSATQGTTQAGQNLGNNTSWKQQPQREPVGPFAAWRVVVYGGLPEAECVSEVQVCMFQLHRDRPHEPRVHKFSSTMGREEESDGQKE